MGGNETKWEGMGRNDTESEKPSNKRALTLGRVCCTGGSESDRKFAVNVVTTLNATCVFMGRRLLAANPPFKTNKISPALMLPFNRCLIDNHVCFSGCFCRWEWSLHSRLRSRLHSRISRGLSSESFHDDM